MRRLDQKPKFWLTVEKSKSIFDIFRPRLDFDEPIPSFETRFTGRLESILESVKQTFKKQYLNSTVLDAATAYFNQLTRGHPFRNGNKRMAVLFTHLFLLKHGIDFTLGYKDMYNFAVLIARFNKKEKLSNQIIKKTCKKIINDNTKELNLLEWRLKNLGL